MIPANWIKEAGVDAGQAFPVGPDSLLDNPGSNDPLNFLPLQHTSGGAGIIGEYQYRTWQPADSVIKVAIDRVRSTSPLSAHDSVNLWLGLDTLNARIGKGSHSPRFVPANYADVVNGKGCLFFVDSMLVQLKTLEGTGASGLEVSLFDSVGNIVHCDVRFAYEAFLQDQWIGSAGTPHEFLHGLGQGHSLCGSHRWNSVMRGVDPVACAGPVETQVASDLDLVYLEMVYEVSAIQRANKTSIGPMEWLNGSLVAQGKAPVTQVPAPLP
jgi:hypothetical protein